MIDYEFLGAINLAQDLSSNTIRVTLIRRAIIVAAVAACVSLVILGKSRVR